MFNGEAMILSVTFSKPTSKVEELLGRPYEKIKINIENAAGKTGYFAQMFTQKQVFHQHFTEEELNTFIKEHAGTTFKNCITRTQTEEITILANKKGKITELKKKLPAAANKPSVSKTASPLQSLKLPPENISQKKKNYLLPEGTPVPFLVMLGVMTADGKVIASRYDKFRQINRFLEFINDILPEVTKNKNESEPLHIIDFGCGKSYLTFAVHYFLTEIRQLPCNIEGLDLKQDVIDYCNEMAKKLNLKGLIFKTGDISEYSEKATPDIVITLHACDTATDFALKYAVEKGARAILSVPCCQHQINQQLKKNQKDEISQSFAPLLKWGIIREKFSSLVTDALRGEWLEAQGYKVQMLEFIDMEHTPKNILIRATKNTSAVKTDVLPDLTKELKINPEIWK